MLKALLANLTDGLSLIVSYNKKIIAVKKWTCIPGTRCVTSKKVEPSNKRVAIKNFGKQESENPTLARILKHARKISDAVL